MFRNMHPFDEYIKNYFTFFVQEKQKKPSYFFIRRRTNQTQNQKKEGFQD